MSKTVISVKIDTEVKEEAQAVAKSIGLTLSTVVNSYLRQVVATRRIELFAPEAMSPKLLAKAEKVESEISQGKVSPAFTEVDELLKALRT